MLLFKSSVAKVANLWISFKYTKNSIRCQGGWQWYDTSCHQLPKTSYIWRTIKQLSCRLRYKSKFQSNNQRKNDIERLQQTWLYKQPTSAPRRQKPVNTSSKITGIFLLWHSLTSTRWKRGSIKCIPPAAWITVKNIQQYTHKIKSSFIFSIPHYSNSYLPFHVILEKSYQALTLPYHMLCTTWC